MVNNYPSSFVQQCSTKMAFIIDCKHGLPGRTLSTHFMDNFPLNSDIFLFYSNTEPSMVRQLERIEANNRAIFHFSTSANGIESNIAFLLGKINRLYNDFILIVQLDPVYEDLCQHLIDENNALTDHIQVRSFERINEFEQFLQKMARLENEDHAAKFDENQDIKIIYSKDQLFHPCPFESRLESSNIYRFGELLHHLDTQHPTVQYKFCEVCQNMLENHNMKEQELFEGHIRDEHWTHRGFQLIIKPLS